MSLLIKKVTKLIDQHSGSFTDCPGCPTCQQIQSLSQQWSDDISYKQTVKRLLAKREYMTKSDIIHLIEIGVTRRQIQKASKMKAEVFAEIIRAWGLNRNTGRKAQ